MLFDTNPSFRALCRAIEQHEAFKKEVSDVMTYIKALYPTLPRNFDRFIILKPKPDPLVDVLADTFGASLIAAADRIEQLEREKAVVSDLWEQQKEIALDYLADCNKAAHLIEAQAAEIEWLRVETKAQFDRGYYDGCTRAALGQSK
jgi:hypothetical protein